MSLHTNLRIITQNRKACKKILDGLNIEQINHIPTGFNNNIIWNCAHILSVQQFLTYGLGKQPFTLPTEQVLAFTAGTKPEKQYDMEFVEMIKSQFFTTIEQLEKDIATDHFKNFNTYMTPIKVELTGIKSAITFNQYHEALHMGYLLNIKRFL